MTNPPLRVLLVDANAEYRQLIRWALTHLIPSIAVDEMSSGQDLIDWMNHQRMQAADEAAPPALEVTIVLLDMHLPTLTGLQTLDYLGDRCDLPYMPVVMVSASPSDQLKQEAYGRGIHLFMLKPASTNGLYRVVEAVKLCYRDVLGIREQQRNRTDFR